MIPVLPHIPYSDGRAELRLDEKVLQVGWIRTEAKGPPSGFVTGDKGDKIKYLLCRQRGASLVGQMVKNPLAMQETGV